MIINWTCEILNHVYYIKRSLLGLPQFSKLKKKNIKNNSNNNNNTTKDTAYPITWVSDYYSTLPLQKKKHIIILRPKAVLTPLSHPQNPLFHREGNVEYDDDDRRQMIKRQILKNPQNL